MGMGKTMIVMVAVAVAAAIAVVAGTKSELVECHAYSDPVIHVEFPAALAGLTMETREVFAGDNDEYALVYKGKEGSPPLKRTLSIYVYADDRPMPDGVNAAVERVIDENGAATKDVWPAAISSGTSSLGEFAKCGLDYIWNSYLFSDSDRNVTVSSVVLAFAFRNRIINLLYTEPAPDDMKKPCEQLPQRMIRILSELDELIKASEVDVYGISDPTNRLAAIRAKWPRAADSVSQWEMPDYRDRFLVLDEIQDWCNEDPASRYGQFEECCRDAVATKMEPAVWFYNLACALAVQGKPKNEVFDALEQAVAAGYCKHHETRADRDFQSVTNDARFAKLCEAMESIEYPWNAPPDALVEGAAECMLSEDNVYYGLRSGSYLCYIVATSAWPVVYLNRHVDHDVVPCEGMVAPKFPKEAVEAGRSRGPANMHFMHIILSDLSKRNLYCPTIAASDWMFDEDDRTECSRSLPAAFGLEDKFAESEWEHHIEWNNISICSAAWDYGVDGIDRFIGHFPLCIAYTGGADEADRFVRLCHDVIEAMPRKIEGRKLASIRALNIIRHAQKCVKGEADFMSGIAQRPVLKFSDIDVARAVALATNAASPTAVTPPIKGSSIASRATPCTDLRRPFDTIQMSLSLFNHTYIARQAERTLSIRVEMYDPESGELVWKVLQGNEDKVRIVPQKDDKSIVQIEVDWHNVFDVPLPDGTAVKSSRVDIGCFRVYDGIASIPAIVSVYFSPNAAREYGADGKLVSIDYTKRQLDCFTPNLCTRGDWKDVFHWNEDGEMTGWTRLCADTGGRVTTNEFTREGFVVDSRDALGRPKDVHRSLTSRWKQSLNTADFTNDTGRAKICQLGSKYDRKEDPPDETDLAWKYEYRSDADQFGEPSQKKPAPFRYRPELCLRADFSEESGFALPLMDQMQFGFYTHVGYRHDTIGWFTRADELMRGDSRYALQVKGLKQPDALKRMRFSSWNAKSNDVWRVGRDEERAPLFELGDGVYRLRYLDLVSKTMEYKFASVRDSYAHENNKHEESAYRQLDEAYRRCSADEVRAIGFHNGGFYEPEWDKVEIVESGHLQQDDLPDGKYEMLSAWQITEDVYLGVHASSTAFRDRVYYFVKMDKATGNAMPLAFFRQLPSPSIGNTVLGADAGEADALNNLAVLLYAGIANPDHYDESAVVNLLRRAEKLGCSSARSNLEVLRYNRGEVGTAIKEAQ